MLLICPVRPGDRNEELRYALRSWETNLLGSHTLITVGHRPSWLTPDQHYAGNRYTSVNRAVWDNIHVVSDAVAGENPSDGDVLYMNDDFFCLEPTESVPVLRRNLTLAQHVKLSGPPSAGWWPASLALTASWLAGEGFPHPDSYELHRPFLAVPSLMAKSLDRFDAASNDVLPQWRTLYGVLNNVEAHPVSDVKLGIHGFTGFGSGWVSTSDYSWPKYRATISRRFQKPSRWEV